MTITPDREEGLPFLAWPPASPPLPRYVRFQRYELTLRRHWTLVPHGDRFLAKACGETYLQLHADNLDLDNPESILGFANEYGALMASITTSASSPGCGSRARTGATSQRSDHPTGSPQGS